ncbi:hypothetical protein [Burkholderia cenocepacia]|uniref:hypothetical protein n=1 Tax=Burkholderia cenocepacia TaxID=95486 RepID=UPI00286F346C|nr:hypothetical protein [Burkholderia cenocepacia]
MIRTIAALAALSATTATANAADTGAVTHSPDRGQKVVRGMGPDGKPRNELRAYDKRADLEAEHQRLGCQ